MTQPIITTAGPFPDSFIGIHFNHFLKQVGVHTAPHPLPVGQEKYVSGDEFEDMKLHLLSGVQDGQHLVDRARQLFFSVERITKPPRLNEQTVKVIAATLAHQAALSAYLGVGTNYRMYRLYAQIHEYFAYASTSEREKRDHVYRMVWGFAHYAQRFQDRDEDAITPWSEVIGALYEARRVAHPDHAQALARYLEIAKAGPPEEPLNLDDVLKVLNPGGSDDFRTMFMTELNRFLDTQEMDFPPEQHLTFEPLRLVDDGSGSLLTRLSIKDSSGGHTQYPIAIQVTQLSGHDAEGSSQVGTTVVSIKDAVHD